MSKPSKARKMRTPGRRGKYAGSLKKAWKAAVPPPDNPMLRHRETTADVRIVPSSPESAALAGRGPYRAKRGRRQALLAPPLTTDRKLVAHRRLAAVSQARRGDEAASGGSVRA